MAVQALPIPKPYKRLGAFPLDEDSVFYDLASMEAYIAGGSAYPGHVVSLVSIVQNKVDTFKILPDKSYVATGGTDEKNKGWKATEAQLNTDLPVGESGWFALVGETDTFWTWDADTNAWVNTDSKQAPISVDANPIEGSLNPVSSGGVYAALSAIKTRRQLNPGTNILSDAQTISIDCSKQAVLRYSFSDGVITGIISFSNISSIEEYKNKLIIDNSANNSGLTLTLNDNSGGIIFDNATNDFPGNYPNINIPPKTKWILRIENESDSVIYINYIER